MGDGKSGLGMLIRAGLGWMLALEVLVAGLFVIPAEAVHHTFQVGDIFVGVADGQVQWRDSDGNRIHELNTGTHSFTTGMAFDTDGKLYVTTFGGNNITVFNTDGTLYGTFGPDAIGRSNCLPESIVFDPAGNAYVGQGGCRAGDVLKFAPDGSSLSSLNVRTEETGPVWIDLTVDPGNGHQCIFYTSGGSNAKVFDVTARRQLPDFNAIPFGGSTFQLRVLPTGGLVVATLNDIFRLDNSGSVVEAYGHGPGNCWYGLSLDPDGGSLWAVDFCSSNVWQFDIDSGDPLLHFNTDTGAATAVGLAVFGSPVMPQNPCIASAGVTEKGRMTGAGSVVTPAKRVIYGFRLHCDATQRPNHLNVHWGSHNTFRLDQLSTAACSNDPAISPGASAAGFDTYSGTGTGRLNGVSGASAEWTFTDAGKPGKKNNSVHIVIRDSNGAVVLSVSGEVTHGNNQAH